MSRRSHRSYCIEEWSMPGRGSPQTVRVSASQKGTLRKEFYSDGKRPARDGTLKRLFHTARKFQPTVHLLSVCVALYSVVMLVSGMTFFPLWNRGRCGGDRSPDVGSTYYTRFWTYVKIQVVCIGFTGMWMLALYSSSESLKVGMAEIETADDNIRHDLRVFFEEMSYTINSLVNNYAIPVLGIAYDQLQDGNAMARTVVKDLMEASRSARRAFLYEGPRFHPILEAVIDDLKENTDSSVVGKANDQFDQLTRDLDLEMSKVYLTLTEEVAILKSAQRKVVSEIIREVMDAMDDVCRSYTQSINDTVALIGSFNVLYLNGSVIDFRKTRPYSNILLTLSPLLVAFVEGGMIFGFLAGVFGYKDSVAPTKRSALSNMGGVVLILQCNPRQSYASLVNVSFFPLDKLSIPEHRSQLVDDDQGIYLPGLFNERTLPAVQLKAQALVTRIDRDPAFSERMNAASRHFSQLNSSSRSLLEALRRANGDKESVLVDVERALLAYLNRTVNSLARMKETVRQKIKTEVGSCDALHDMAGAAFMITCGVISDAMNGLWLSLFCCILTLTVCIMMGLMMSSYFLRQKSYKADAPLPATEEPTGAGQCPRGQAASSTVVLEGDALETRKPSSSMCYPEGFLEELATHTVQRSLEAELPFASYRTNRSRSDLDRAGIPQDRRVDLH